MELKDTVNGMLNSDYKERFKAEYRQVAIRLSKLERMLIDWQNGCLNFTPSCPYALLETQVNAMNIYLRILEKRAEIEKVELD